MSIAIWILSAIVTLAGYLCHRYPKILLSTYMPEKPMREPEAYVQFAARAFWLTAAFILINYHICYWHQAYMISEIALPLSLIWGIVGISFTSQNIQKKGKQYYKNSLILLAVSFLFLSSIMFFMV